MVSETILQLELHDGTGRESAEENDPSLSALERRSLKRRNQATHGASSCE